jgi:hypothetical protein
MMDRIHLLQILATDGLWSLIGLSQEEPHLMGVLRTFVRQRLVRVTRPALKPTGYSRRVIPTDIAVLTSTGRLEAERCLGRPAIAAAPNHEVEHRLGVAVLRTRLHIPPNDWIAARDVQVVRMAGIAGRDVRALPDGLADICGVRLAFEFDHGRYTAVQIRHKLLEFKRLAGETVWAAPTEGRARWLQDLGCERVLTVPLPLGVWGKSVDSGPTETS